MGKQANKKKVTKKESIHQTLARIQRELKAPKGQYNDYSHFAYRSCEDILEAVKPLLRDCYLLIEDEIVMIGDRYYVKARAVLANGNEQIIGRAYARETESRTGMDASQITGASSSYARKYALNGLFAIDDARDADVVDVDQKKPKVKGKGKSKKMTVTTVGSFIKEMKAGLTKANISVWEKKIKEKKCSDSQRIVLKRKLEALVKDLK